MKFGNPIADVTVSGTIPVTGDVGLVPGTEVNLPAGTSVAIDGPVEANIVSGSVEVSSGTVDIGTITAGTVSVDNDTPYLANQATQMAFGSASVASGAAPVKLLAMVSSAPVAQVIRIQRVLLSYTADSTHVATLSTILNPPGTVFSWPTIPGSAPPVVIELTPGYFEATTVVGGGNAYFQDWSIALSGTGGNLTVYMLVIFNVV